MQLSRSRGISHPSQRDFEQERANLTEGYNNYKQWVATSIAEVSESNEYSSEQKRHLLNVYKADLEQKQQEYNNALQEINLAEKQLTAEYTDEYNYGQGHTNDADVYCSFAKQPEGIASYESGTYCGTASIEEPSDDYSIDGDHANDMQ